MYIKQLDEDYNSTKLWLVIDPSFRRRVHCVVCLFVGLRLQHPCLLCVWGRASPLSKLRTSRQGGNRNRIKFSAISIVRISGQIDIPSSVVDMWQKKVSVRAWSAGDQAERKRSLHEEE